MNSLFPFEILTEEFKIAGFWDFFFAFFTDIYSEMYCSINTDGFLISTACVTLH